MQAVLGKFIQALRDEGVPVSTAETLDALETARLVGVRNRQTLQQALSLVLAKTVPHKQQFDQLYQRFFDSATPQVATRDSLKSSDQPSSLALANPLSSVVEAESILGRQLLAGNASEIQLAIAAAAEAAGSAQMEVFTQKPMVTYRIMRELGDEALRDELIALEAAAGQGQSRRLLDTLESHRKLLRESVADFVERQFLLSAESRGQKLRDDTLEKISLTAVDKQNQAQMARLVRRAAKQLASQHSRRRRETRRGMLDVRRTIAANAAYDGLLFNTQWKKTRVDRPKIVVICDISGSVSAVARFFLLFVYSLQDVLPRVRSFVFTSDLNEVTEPLASLDIDNAMSMIMNRFANGSTDYGVALRNLRDTALKDIDNKTTVIMLGDARNNQGASEALIWQQVYKQSKRVLWLNPENKNRWNSSDSVISAYAPYCSRVESCNSLRDLTRVLSRVLKHA